MSKLIIRLISILMVTVLMAGFGANTASASGENWLSGWNNRVKLTIDHNKIDSALSDFPVMVHLSSSSGISAADVSFVFDALGADANRKKIAITTSDGKTQLYVEIEKWDSASKQAWLWVKVPSISNTVDTDLYLYYDSNHADNNDMVGDAGSTPAQNVWDSNFKMVHHYTESGNGSIGEFQDSTSRKNNGTGGGGSSSSTPTLTTGKIGSGQSYDGSNDYIEIPDSDDFSVTTTGYLTISFWFNPSTLTFQGDWGEPYIRIMGKGDSFDPAYNHEWQIVWYNDSYDRTKNWMTAYYYNLDLKPDGLGMGSRITGINFGLNQWTRCTLRVDAQYMHFMADEGPWVPWSGSGNGDYKVDYTAAEYPGPITPGNGDAPLRIGTQWLGTNYNWLKGKIDELRISGAYRSDAWLKASYYSDSDYLVYYSVNEGTTNRPPVLGSIGNKTVTEEHSLNFTISATDPDNDPLTYSASGLPSGASFDQGTRTFSWTPGSNQAGIYNNIHFEVSDGSLIDSEDITITVTLIYPAWDVDKDG